MSGFISEKLVSKISEILSKSDNEIEILDQIRDIPDIAVWENDGGYMGGRDVNDVDSCSSGGEGPPERKVYKCIASCVFFGKLFESYDRLYINEGRIDCYLLEDIPKYGYNKGYRVQFQKSEIEEIKEEKLSKIYKIISDFGYKDAIVKEISRRRSTYGCSVMCQFVRDYGDKKVGEIRVFKPSELREYKSTADDILLESAKIKTHYIEQDKIEDDFGEYATTGNNEVPSKNLKFKRADKIDTIDYINDQSFINYFKQAEQETKNRYSLYKLAEMKPLFSSDYILREIIGDFTTRLRRYLNSHPYYKELQFLFNTDYWYRASVSAVIWPHYLNKEVEIVKMLDFLQSISQSSGDKDVKDSLKQDLSDMQKLVTCMDQLNNRVDVPVNNINRIMEEMSVV